MPENSTAYGELAQVIKELPVLVRERRKQDGSSVREAARRIGVAASTVCRVETGDLPNGENMVLILQWLDRGVL